MAVVWRYALEPGELAATPLCVGRQVLFGVDPQHGTVLNEVRSAAIRSVSRANGTLDWEYRGEAELGARVRHPPVVSGDLVFVATLLDLVVLDLASGALRWRVRGHHGCRPLPHGGLLYASRESELLVLDPDTGKILNRRRCGSQIDAVARHPDGDLLLSMNRRLVLRLDPATLLTRQTYRLAGTWAVGAPVVVVDELDLLVVNSWAGFVYGIDAATGAVRWRRKKVPGRLGVTLPRRSGRGAVHHSGPSDDGYRHGCCAVAAARTGPACGGRRHARPRADGGADGGYELVVVARETGTVTARLPYGTSEYEQQFVYWKDNGFAVDAGVVLASHVPGEVVALDMSAASVSFDLSGSSVSAGGDP